MTNTDIKRLEDIKTYICNAVVTLNGITEQNENLQNALNTFYDLYHVIRREIRKREA